MAESLPPTRCRCAQTQRRDHKNQQKSAPSVALHYHACRPSLSIISTPYGRRSCSNCRRSAKNGGREWRPKGAPEAVRVHDFLIPDLGRAVPYGVYDIAANAGWVSVGVDHDTASFAVNAIRRWWRLMGSARYPNATHLTITADGGGSNGAKLRLWKGAGSLRGAELSYILAATVLLAAGA